MNQGTGRQGEGLGGAVAREIYCFLMARVSPGVERDGGRVKGGDRREE